MLYLCVNQPSICIIFVTLKSKNVTKKSVYRYSAFIFVHCFYQSHEIPFHQAASFIDYIALKAYLAHHMQLASFVKMIKENISGIELYDPDQQLWGVD